jgi:hypothetical protein
MPLVLLLYLEILQLQAVAKLLRVPVLVHRVVLVAVAAVRQMVALALQVKEMLEVTVLVVAPIMAMVAAAVLGLLE